MYNGDESGSQNSEQVMVWKCSVPKGGRWTEKLKIGSSGTSSDVKSKMEYPNSVGHIVE